MSLASEISDEKRHGQHYTPTELARFLARRSFGRFDLETSNSITVVDPACGDGELLIAAAHVARAAGYRGLVNLVGYDIDATAVEIAVKRLEAADLTGVVIAGDFLTLQREMKSSSIDVIVTNPPYVRTQHLGQATAQLLAVEFGLTGRVDLTHPFVAAASRILRPDGVLGLLCSNRFLTTISGINIRRTLMHDGLQVNEIYDLGDTKLFKAAVLPAVVIASKTALSGVPAKYVSAYEQLEPSVNSDPSPLFDALECAESSVSIHNSKHYNVRVGTFNAPADTSIPWRLSDPDGDQWLERVRQGTWKTFGDVAKIRVGIKSTADKVFLRDNWDKIEPQIESDILLPLVTQGNITPWRISDHLEMKVLYPYDLTVERRRVLDINDWPGAKTYLLAHEAQLRGRNYVIDGGREWYELWVPQRPALWARPKIVFPDISEQPRFALDTTGAIVNGNCYWISTDDLPNEDIAFLILAVANSTLGIRFYDEVCGNKLYSGKRRWITQYVSRLPLPEPETPEAKRLVLTARAMVSRDANSVDDLAQLDREVEEAFVRSPSSMRASRHSGLEVSLF